MMHNFNEMLTESKGREREREWEKWRETERQAVEKKPKMAIDK